MTDLRAQIETLLTPMEHLPARRISDPDDIPRCKVCGILLAPENSHRSLCPVPAVLALIPEGSVLVTPRLRGKTLAAAMKNTRSHAVSMTDYRDGTFVECLDAAAIRAALTPESTSGEIQVKMRVIEEHVYPKGVHVIDRVQVESASFIAPGKGPDSPADDFLSSHEEGLAMTNDAPILRAQIEARDVYEAWAAAMDRQGRVVAPERRTWDLLPQQEKDLDADIAYQLNRVSPGSVPNYGLRTWLSCDCGFDEKLDGARWESHLRAALTPEPTDDGTP
jgi:hypothetical protein